MFKYALTFLTLLAITSCDEGRRRRYEDPFAALDKQISHSLAYHYLWPWTQLINAAAALDIEDALEEPKIISNEKKFEVNIYARRFKPEELRVRVKNHYIVIEGRHKEDKNDQRFMANQFEQRYVLPRGSIPDEVTALYTDKGVLVVTVPKHELPPERIVPIEVKLPEKTTENPIEITTEKEIETTEKLEESTQKKEEEVKKPELEVVSSSKPVEETDMVEATTHVGKIRKKELKTAVKTAKDNEVSKGVDENGLEYELVE